MATKRSPKDWAKRKGGFVQLYEEWLASPAYADLSAVARALLIEFYRIHRPERNGRLVLSVVDAGKRLKVSKNTVAPAFHELAEHGFIKLTKGSLWQYHLAREWVLTTEKCQGRAPTDEWREWRPKEKSRSQNLGQPVPETGTDKPKGAKSRAVPTATAEASLI